MTDREPHGVAIEGRHRIKETPGIEIEINTSSRDLSLAIASSTMLLKEVFADADSQLPWLKQKESNDQFSSDADIKLRHVHGLLDAYSAIHKRDAPTKNRFTSNWGMHSDYLEARINQIDANVEAQQEKLYEESTNWTTQDERKVVRDAHKFAANLTKDQKDILYSSTGLSPEKVKEKLGRWGITVGANVASTYALDGTAVIAGLALTKTGIQEHVSTETLIGFLAASYGVWFKGLYENVKENWKLLEEQGVSTSALSKAFHDYSKSKGWSERSQRLATAAGYVGLEIAKELPFYLGAFGSATFFEGISDKDAITFLAGANIGGGFYEYTLAKGTKMARKWMGRRTQKPERPSR